MRLPHLAAAASFAGADAADVRFRSTTILSVRRHGRVVLAGDGQVTLGATVVKDGAKKVRRLGDGSAIAGFAGSAADGMALFERLDSKLRESRGNLRRAAVELSKDWRTDKAMRRLEAMIIVADREGTYLLSGSGDIIEPDQGIVAIGSGGPFALAAALALADQTELGAREICQSAMAIAAKICIYTNANLTIEEVES